MKILAIIAAATLVFVIGARMPDAVLIFITLALSVIAEGVQLGAFTKTTVA